MPPSDVFKKTPKGEEEISVRTINLPVKLRSLLIAMDGKKSSGEMARSFGALGDIPAMITELERQGCIELVPETRALHDIVAPVVHTLNIEARRSAANYLYGLLGPESESLVRRIEKCKTNVDLSLMLDECRDVLVSMGKPAKAEEFWNMGKEMLS